LHSALPQGLFIHEAHHPLALPHTKYYIGGVIRKYKACALWKKYKHGGVSPTYE